MGAENAAFRPQRRRVERQFLAAAAEFGRRPRATFADVRCHAVLALGATLAAEELEQLAAGPDEEDAVQRAWRDAIWHARTRAPVTA